MTTYKNVGLIGSSNILVFYSLLDDLILINICKNFKQLLLTKIIKNIKVRKPLDQDKNRIIN